MSLLNLLDRYSAALLGIAPRSNFIANQPLTRAGETKDKGPSLPEVDMKFRQKFYQTYSQVMINK